MGSRIRRVLLLRNAGVIKHKRRPKRESGKKREGKTALGPRKLVQSGGPE